MTERRRLRVRGTVQGVGFRPFVYRTAVALGLAGSVWNDSEGVVVEAEGRSEVLDELARRIAEEAPPLAAVTSVEATPLPPAAAERPPPAAATSVGAMPQVPGAGSGAPSFVIVDSRADVAPAVAVSADAATCADCLAELHDPADRRFGYPFVNCTNCGPRYTIIRSIPYDRAATTMAGFEMCAACRAEYEDPADRRFHAEPNACPVCGPRLRYLDTGGALLAEAGDALDAAAADLVAGRILAVKGLGGWHLAVDAGNEAAVADLRRRKARDDKPFAVMVPDLPAAHALCRLSPAAAEALASPRRPIVLANRQPDAPVASGVAPGLPELGLMLPYTPLHDLLLARTDRPLVMTSGNRSDEPIAHTDADAVARLGPMVDALLGHNRPIHIRCDDSVVRDLGIPDDGTADRDPGQLPGDRPAGEDRGEPAAGRPSPADPAAASTVLATPGSGFRTHAPQEGREPVRAAATGVVGPGGIQVLRRSRGFAPQPLALPVAARRHILAVGAELKNTVAVAKGAGVVASHHIGDLEHLPAYQSFLQAVEHLCHLAGVEPEVVVHDLHPEYLSTKFALDLDLPAVGVQHHHAHIASCLVDHGRDEQVLGVAFDGTGYGCDRSLWGGEFLVAGLRGFERVGHLAAVPLPGGAMAIREPWRMGMVWAGEALGRDAAERFGASVDDRWEAVLAVAGLDRTPQTTSAGRLFDAVASLLGVRHRVTYEGQAAIELEALAASVPFADAPDYRLDPPAGGTAAGPVVLDPSPLVAQVLAERDRGTPAALVAAGFHLALGRAVADLACRLAAVGGLGTVALSGGVFQNARLTAVVADEVER
ncbi:MAG: carbamoyltransferase HypF, partial [Acidimicrobiales bacterium]